MTRLGKGAQSSKAEKGDLRIGRGRCGEGQPARPQMRRWRKRIWNDERRARFLEVLSATCNVQEAARAVAMNKGGAYDLRRRDAGFAAQWKEALETGYAELEMALLHHSIHGTMTTETIDDGGESGKKRVKTVHSYPLATALRLFLGHKEQVEAFREERGIGRPGSESVRAEIYARIAAMRARMSGAEPDDGDNAPVDESGGEDA